MLIFSLVFINTFCLFSGATGVAFIIDDAHRRGADAGTATSGAILSQIGYFAAVLVISVIGFVTMLVSGTMNTLFLIGGCRCGRASFFRACLSGTKPRVLLGKPSSRSLSIGCSAFSRNA